MNREGAGQNGPVHKKAEVKGKLAVLAEIGSHPSDRACSGEEAPEPRGVLTAARLKSDRSDEGDKARLHVGYK